VAEGKDEEIDLDTLHAMMIAQGALLVMLTAREKRRYRQFTSQALTVFDTILGCRLLHGDGGTARKRGQSTRAFRAFTQPVVRGRA
jgi:hypothetical protein